MDKRNHERVTVTLELPVEVAEFLIRDGKELLKAVQLGLNHYRQNPPAEIAEKAHQAKEQQSQDRARKLVLLGRSGYRLLRRGMVEAYPADVQLDPAPTPYEKQKTQRLRG